MEILIGILIGICITAALSASFSFWMICGILSFNTKRLNFYNQVMIYSLLVAIISFFTCIILIKTP